MTRAVQLPKGKEQKDAATELDIAVRRIVRALPTVPGVDGVRRFLNNVSFSTNCFHCLAEIVGVVGPWWQVEANGFPHGFLLTSQDGNCEEANKIADALERMAADEQCRLADSGESADEEDNLPTILEEAFGRGRVECIAEVAVETGQLVIADPCRLGEEGREFVDRNPNKPPDNLAVLDQVVPDPDPDHRAVVVQTGIGDGVYPVFAHYVDFGQWGERIMSVTIDCRPRFYDPRAVPPAIAAEQESSKPCP
jgi:hypothetical protein